MNFFITISLVAYWIFGVCSGLCFRQGGVDVPHRLRFFLLGCACGLICTFFLTRLLARMNANLAVILSTGGVFVLFQISCWIIFSVQISLLEWTGILMVLAGMVLVMTAPPPSPVPARPDAEPSEEAA